MKGEQLDDMEKLQVELVESAFFIFIESYAKFELYSEAIGVLNMMWNDLLLNVLVDRNKLKLVENVHSRMLDEGVKADEMPMYGLVPDERIFTTIMQGYIVEGNLDGALRIRDLMVSAKCPASSITLNLLFHGYCKEGRIDEALNFVQDMCSRGFSPDQFTFNTLINGLCKAGHATVDPDVYTYNILISGLCELGEMLLRDCTPNTVTYYTIISTLCKENQVQEVTEFARLCFTGNFGVAMELFEEMKSKGCQPDEFTYNILIDCLCAKRRIGEAMDLLKDMESSGCARSMITYNALIDAEEIFDQMELQGVSINLVTFNTLIDGLCESRRVEDAAQLMDQMILERLKSDKFTYNSILAHFCRAGDIKKAADIVQNMTSNGCEPDIVTYGTLIQGLCKTGRVEVASRFLRSIQMNGMILTPQAYNPETTNPPDALSYKIVFRGLSSGGGPIQEAIDFAVEMMIVFFTREETLIKLVGMIMEKANFSDSEVTMIKGFLKIRKFQDALATLGRVLNSRNPTKA
ncbi:unnamed protein product [Withania somnifera]